MRTAKQNHLLPARRMHYTAQRWQDLCTLVQRSSALVAILIAIGCSGCSVPRGSSFAAAEDEREATGSIASAATLAPATPSETDLAFARAAASDVLTQGTENSSQPWENPATGVRGSVTPIATAYTADGRTCRDFLASFVNGRSENWLQGAACQSARGHWDIQAMKPWKRG